MESNDNEKTYCDDDGEYRNVFHVKDKLAIDSDFNNHLESPTHVKYFRERQQLNFTNNGTSLQNNSYKLNNKTKLLEDYVDYVDCPLREHANFDETTTRQNT